MDVKQFTKAPEDALEALGIEPETDRAQRALAVAAQARTARQALKAAKGDKAAVAKGFRHLDQDSPDYPAQIERMKTVTEAVKEAESELKHCEKNLKATLRELIAPLTGGDTAQHPPLFRVPDRGAYRGHFFIEELPASRYDLWDAFLESLSSPVPVYARTAWLSVMRKTFDRPTRVWVAVDAEGNLLGGVPISLFNNRLFGRFGVSLPYVNYGGLYTDYPNVAQTLMRHLYDVRERERLDHIEVRTTQAGFEPPSVGRKVSMIRALQSSVFELDASLPSKVRAQCRKAEAYGPEFVIGGIELLDDFYRVFATNMRDLGTPVYDKALFSNILGHSTLNARIALVKVDGRTVSCGFLMGANGMLEIPWASTLKSANRLDANMWMYRQILNYAVREGYQYFDFGRSTRESGTYRFKKQWGATPYEHAWYYVLPENGTVPGLNPDNPKFRVAIAVWKRLPVWLTRKVGPIIIRHIP